jgi:signal transduction histidine kinase
MPAQVRSLSNTITISTILWVALILAVGQIVVDKVVSSLLLSQFDTVLESKARALVTLTKFDGVEVELDFADEFMPEFEAPDNPEYFALFLGNGNLLERSHSFDGHPELQFSDQSDELLISDLKLPDGRMGRRISIKFIPQIEDKDKSLRKAIALEDRPRAILQVSRERETLDQTIMRFHLLLVGISIVVLVAVMLSVTRAIRLGLKPLIQIKNDISQISPDALDRGITTAGQPKELEPIATQFNLVLVEIEKALNRERRFSSDVAHELRTPVSEIRSLAEVGLRWPDEKDIRSYFADIYDSSRQLDRLIENLLHLCRSEEGSIELELSEIKLDEIIEKVCRSLVEETDEKGIVIERPKTPLPLVLADNQWLELVLQNLIFNAVSHSPSGATITLTATTDADYCGLELENPMEDPLSAQDLDLIFKRFWRKDAARETGRHAGIGLSLVKSYVDLMDLKVHATISDNNFCISLSGLKVA